VNTAPNICMDGWMDVQQKPFADMNMNGMNAKINEI
jgi:hypothetical protein